jgi:hypothetical protein
MNNLSQNQSKIFKGAGWLMGALLAIVVDLVIITLTDNIIAAVSGALPVLFFAGFSIEKKFQEEYEQLESKNTKVMIGSFLLGFIIFLAFYTILNH